MIKMHKLFLLVILLEFINCRNTIRISSNYKIESLIFISDTVFLKKKHIFLKYNDILVKAHSNQDNFIFKNRETLITINHDKSIIIINNKKDGRNAIRFYSNNLIDSIWYLNKNEISEKIYYNGENIMPDFKNIISDNKYENNKVYLSNVYCKNIKIYCNCSIIHDSIGITEQSFPNIFDPRKSDTLAYMHLKDVDKGMYEYNDYVDHKSKFYLIKYDSIREYIYFEEIRR